MRVLLTIPVHNEERYVRGVLRAVRKYAADILVIDDGSTDATPALLRQEPGIRVISHPENRGYGQSLIDAFRYADQHGYDWVVTMDCDEQHEPSQVPDFLAAMQRDDADVISGSRYLHERGADDDAPPERRRINRTINTLLWQVLGIHLTDSFCGFKALRVSAMRRLELDEPGYAFPLQFWVQCAHADLRIREIPVWRIYRDKNRRFGGTLDDPPARLAHYLAVFVRALQSAAVAPATECTLPACRPTSHD